MAKAKRELNVRNQVGANLKHVEEFDDSLLCSPEQLEHYEKIRPEIVTWMMERAVIEQNFRHDITKEKNKIVSKGLNQEFILNFIGMLFCFAVLTMGGYYSYHLIMNNQTLVGSIFATVNLIAAAGLLYNYNSRIKRPQ
jgi:uncharacterized membrane protein